MFSSLPSLPAGHLWSVSSAEDNGREPAPRMSLPGETLPSGKEPETDVDAALVRRMARGDREAFAALYDRFSRPLYATALRVLNDPREAEDVVQEVFLTLWEKAEAFTTERGTAFSWAVTLTRNRAIDRVRTRKRRAELLAASAPGDLGYGEDGGDSGENLWSKEKANVVRAAVASLPLEQKHALELAFFGGLTQQEIAEKLQEPLGTVKARIRRGLLKLRDSVARRL